MFTGIIECPGKVHALQRTGTNLDIVVESPISHALQVDQSVAHDGVCLTVVEVMGNTHRVTAVQETLQRSNLEFLQEGDLLNLERCLRIGDRLDGHIVQGHVDARAEFISAEAVDGSHILQFRFPVAWNKYMVNKGSITLNGISLTLVDVGQDVFSVAIIPYTWEHTNLKKIRPGAMVNLEFDVIGKYVEKMMQR